jgi:hypothetical protein
MKRRIDWVVTNNDLSFECRRCGDRQPMASPINVSVYGAAAKAYMAIHRHCREPKQSTP